MEPADSQAEVNKYSTGETAVVIYMDDYRKAKAASRIEASRIEAGRYDEELLCVNWNPAVSLVAMSCYQRPNELSPALPDEFSPDDVPAFLDRVYALATQV